MDNAKLKYALLVHRMNFDGTALGQMLPYFVWQREHWLSNRDRTVFYRAASGWMSQVETKFFKRTQDFFTLKKFEDVKDYHIDRLLLFYEHLPKYQGKWSYHVAVQLSTFQREFQYYEAILQYRRLGIGLPNLPVWKLVGHWTIRMFVSYFSWKRSKYKLYEDWLWVKTGKLPSDRVLEKHLARIKWLERVIHDSGGAAHYKLLGFSDSYVDWNTEYVQRLVGER